MDVEELLAYAHELLVLCGRSAAHHKLSYEKIRYFDEIWEDYPPILETGKKDGENSLSRF